MLCLLHLQVCCLKVCGLCSGQQLTCGRFQLLPACLLPLQAGLVTALAAVQLGDA